MSTLASNRLHTKHRSTLAIQQESNIQKRVRDENRLRHQMGIETGLRKAALVSTWQDTSEGLVEKEHGNRVAQSKRETLRQASREYVARRRVELRDKLARDSQSYQRALADRGLAMPAPRPAVVRGAKAK
ncbi:hypothetical protein HDU88_002240 [Geranomyces variabilis]|nr:hypothetical protein HDU88_002240 [Geranomyces variabilis]